MGSVVFFYFYYSGHKGSLVDLSYGNGAFALRHMSSTGTGLRTGARRRGQNLFVRPTKQTTTSHKSSQTGRLDVQIELLLIVKM